ncbi:retrovirus-related pol polyprotein from transposon TNT 1-94 [Tanacetum coccineum]
MLDTNQEKLYLLHMDLCGPIRVKSINEKKYILVIIDDYSRFTWVKFLRSKDEASETLCDYYENVGISHQKSVARTPQQNSIVKRRNRTLVEAARTMLIFSKAPLFLWAEVLMHDKKPDLSYLHVFGPSYAHVKKAFRIYNKRLVPNPILLPPYVPPTRNDWDILFQPMFDEFFNPPPSVVSPVPVAAAPRLVNLIGSPVSTLIDQDAPFASNPSTQEHDQSSIISQGVEELPKTLHFHDDPLHETLHEELTSQGSSSNVRPSHTLFELLGRWTKNHPIANVIRDYSRSVSIKKQLKTDAIWCYFDAFLTLVELKNYKEAMLELSWIEAMHE